MPSPACPPTWDVFCKVIDNFGDIGVCWRLARQLAAEHDVALRLWVDELTAFQRICPDIDPLAARQTVGVVDVRRWDADFPEIDPGAVVIEAFACQLPERFVAAMAARKPAPVWINLDYLSAEAWVSGCHALPSPHPRLPLTKYFFFPGFDATTGGLLREADLAQRRAGFHVADFWPGLGMLPPADGSLVVSLFAYENPALAALLESWADGESPVCCLAPVTRTLAAIEAFAGRPLQAGDVVHRGQLELRLLPFVAQPDYDRLLWSCDVNFVRGEDSFVRAQWANKPMVWHIYPQDEDAHRVKLKAFLDRYCADLPPAAAAMQRDLFSAWNGETALSRETWAHWLEFLPDLRENAVAWGNKLIKQEDLCSSLARFCRSKL